MNNIILALKISKKYLISLLLFLIISIYLINFLKTKNLDFEASLKTEFSKTLPHLIIYSFNPEKDLQKIKKLLNNNLKGVNIFYEKELKLKIKASGFRRFTGKIEFIGIKFLDLKQAIDFSRIDTRELSYYSIRPTNLELIYLLKYKKFLIINKALNNAFNKPLTTQMPIFIKKNKFNFIGVINDNSLIPSIYLDSENFKSLFKKYKKGIFLKIKNIKKLDSIRQTLTKKLPTCEIKTFYDKNLMEKKLIDNFKKTSKKIIYFLIIFIDLIFILYIFYIKFKLKKTIIKFNYLGTDITLHIPLIISLIIILSIIFSNLILIKLNGLFLILITYLIFKGIK